MNSYDVVVVGAGPAGLAAVDDKPAAGGQIWRGAPPTLPPEAKVLCGARVIAAPAAGQLTLETLGVAYGVDALEVRSDE